MLVHGLLSSPLSWAETYNELCNDPVLAERYQFWMFLYATGEPIPVAGYLRICGTPCARLSALSIRSGWKSGFNKW